MSETETHYPNVLARLEKMLHWSKGFSLGMVEVCAEEQRERLEGHLRASAPQYTWLELPIKKEMRRLDEVITQKTAGLNKNEPVVLSITGMERTFQLLENELSLLGWLNTNRDLIKSRYPYTWLIWLPPEGMVFFQQDAPDFWSWNRGVYLMEEDSGEARNAFSKRYGAIVRNYFYNLDPGNKGLEALVEEVLDESFHARSSYKGDLSPVAWVLQFANRHAPRTSTARSADFEEVYRRYYQDVLNFFKKRGFGEEEAFDLTQDTFIRVYRGFVEHSAPNHSAYIKEVAYLVWRNRYRTSRSFGSEPKLALSGFLTHSPSPYDELVTSERRSQLLAGIRTLPSPMKEVALMRGQELSYREIATNLGLSLPTVRRNWRRAQAALADGLAG